MRNISLILVILVVIACADDVLTINPQVEIGETFDELFGTTVAWGSGMKKAANDTDSSYIHAMNWCGGLWDSSASAMDTTYKRLAQEAGIKLIRLYLDYSYIPHYSAYKYSSAYESTYFDWRGMIGPPNSERLDSIGTRWDTFIVANTYDGDVYTNDTFYIWYEPGTDDSIILPPRMPFIFKWSSMMKICEELNVTVVPTIMGVMDTLDSDVSPGDSMSPHIYNYCRDIIEYFCSDTGIYAHFRKMYDADSFDVKEIKWMLGNDWFNCFWPKSKFENVPGYKEYLNPIYDDRGNVIEPDSFRYSPYYPYDTSAACSCDSLKGYGRWPRHYAVWSKAVAASMARRVNSFLYALDNFGLEDSMEVGVHIIKYNWRSSVKKPDPHLDYDSDSTKIKENGYWALYWCAESLNIDYVADWSYSSKERGYERIFSRYNFRELQ